MAAIGTGWVDGAWTEAGWVRAGGPAWAGGAALAAQVTTEDATRPAIDFVQTGTTYVRTANRITRTIVRGYD